MQMHWPFFDV